MNMFQKLIERVRSLVGLKGWDYCVLWIFSHDQRFLEWMECCCGGTQNMQNGGEEVEFHLPSLSYLSCKDSIFQHPRTQSCELLAQLPTSISLDSGIHAQTLISNQPRWLNFSNSSDSSVLQETIGTRVLIPVPGGLLELFVTKQVAEDQQVIDYVTSECNIIMEQEGIMDTSFPIMNMINEQQSSKPFLAVDHDNQFQENLAYGNGINNNNNDDNIGSPMNEYFENGNEELQKSVSDKEWDDKECIKQEKGKLDCSYDEGDEENDAKYMRRTGRQPQAKNLHAERKRRKRLNGRLYDLRALVPKISNLNKAAILGDAIEFVKELQKQEKELQQELAEHSDDEIPDVGNNGFHVEPKLNPQTKLEINSQEKGQQMEPQVEVAQIDGDKFFVKVFCEHKAGGFVRLMEALDSLGLEVTNVNITTCRGLVSNVFNVEKKDNEMVEADYVRDFLLELTRDSPRGWPPEVAKASDDDIGMDFHHHHLHHHLHG